MFTSTRLLYAIGRLQQPCTTRLLSMMGPIQTAPSRSIRSSRSLGGERPKAPAWSGKEHTDSMEQKPLASPEDADEELNPTAWIDPIAFHPSGSNSEQIIAGERSPIDPLHPTLKSIHEKHHRQHTRIVTETATVKVESPTPGANFHGKAPSLREIEDKETEDTDTETHFVGP